MNQFFIALPEIWFRKLIFDGNLKEECLKEIESGILQIFKYIGNLIKVEIVKKYIEKLHRIKRRIIS